MGVLEDAGGGVPLDLVGKWDEEYDVGHPLLFHLLDVAAVSLQLWDRFLTPSQRRLIADGMGMPQRQARALVALFAALHDLGKACWWQRERETAWARLPVALRHDAAGWEEIGHARASAHVLIDVLGRWGYPVDGGEAAGVRIAQAISAHHGFILPLDLGGAAAPGRVSEALGGRLWQELRLRYAGVVRYLLGANTVPQRVSAPAAVLLAGVSVVADHLASQRHVWLPLATARSGDAADHFARVGPLARQVVDACGLERVDLPRTGFARAHQLAGPTQLQASLMERMPGLVAEHGPGIVVLADGPGGGKTVACLEVQRVFAERAGARGAVHLLPTTALADQTWQTYEAYVRRHEPERAPVALVHNRSRFHPDYTGARPEPDTQTPATATDGDDTCSGGQESPGDGGDRWEAAEESVTALEGWLRGWDRALLAQWCVATVDQALMAVLPVKFNTVRLLALSGKTVVIDEADAFTAFTTAHLERLLEWLGALGSPVVLVSATLPAGLAQRLVAAYLRGTGQPDSPELAPLPQFDVACPGWAYVSASGRVFTSDPTTTRVQAAAQRRTVQVHHHPVRHRPPAAPGASTGAGAGTGSPAGADRGPGAPVRTRQETVRRLVGPVVRRGGVAAVICATVALAQTTCEQLRAAFPDAATDIVLLHALLPERRVQRTTSRLLRVLGRAGPRPHRLIVVATSVLDIGLDVDVDVMVTDLAALPRLVQRLGRLWRFERWGTLKVLSWRPAWVRRLGPRLHVLEPVDDRGRLRLPVGWPLLEDPYRLEATAVWARTGPAVTVPDQLTELADHLQRPPGDPVLAQRFAAYQAACRHEEHLAAAHLIPAPAWTASLDELSRQRLRPRNTATRLGVNRVRLLPCYRHRDGLTLDRAGRYPLPEGPNLSTARLREILERTVTVPAPWVAQRTTTHPVPASWKEQTWLHDLMLLPLDRDHPDAWHRFGVHLLRLDEDLGVVHRGPRAGT